MLTASASLANGGILQGVFYGHLQKFIGSAPVRVESEGGWSEPTKFGKDWIKRFLHSTCVRVWRARYLGRRKISTSQVLVRSRAGMHMCSLCTVPVLVRA